MISKALQFMGDILGVHLKNRMALDNKRVQLNKLIESNGAIPASNQNKVVISLINIEKETTRPFYNPAGRLRDGSYAEVSPSQRYNLDVLVSSNFDDYQETLKFLDEVALFFQKNAAIDGASYSNIPAGLSRLEFETERITYHQMQSLWTAMGAKYQPSLIYKVRLITIQSDEMTSYIPAIKGYTNETIYEPA